MNRWQRYWFADGGRVTVAILRIAIATAVLMTLSRMHGTWPSNAPGGPGVHEVYRPVGVWMIFGHHQPPELVIDLLWLVARVATVAMLLGARTRTAAAVSFGACLALASLSYAATQTWSHQYNVVLLAQLAFLGARGGDVLSVDWYVRKRRGLPALDIARGYQWSIRLVQLAVAVMFASGMFHKVLHGHFTLRWALSDNLRHHLLIRYDLAGQPRPAIVDWLIDDAWRFRTAAVLNLISQTFPLAACFLIKRPVLRALCGSFFVIETIALGVVMELWNLHWLPLAAVFVDWEALLRVRRPPPQLPAHWQPPRGPRIFVIAFVVYDVLTAFVPGLDQKLNTYPFSGFPMFATIRVRPPYDEHQPYSVSGGHFELVADHPLDAETYRWIDYSYRTMYVVGDPDELRKRLAATLEDARRRYPDAGVREIRLFLTIFEAPAYPEPARFERHPVGILGEYHVDGTFRSALGTLRDDHGKMIATPRPIGVVLAAPHVVYFRDDVPSAHELPALAFDRVDGDPLYIVAVEDAESWVVAVRRKWRWE